MSKISLLGAPIEDGAGRRGCSMGPAAFRTAGIVENLSALGHDVEDLGDAKPEATGPLSTPQSHIKALEEVAGWARSLHVQAKSLAKSDRIPIYLGGDHALSLGTLSGHLEAAQEIGRPLFVLWLDAHADFNTFESSPSGNLHGTPLAFACGLEGFEPILGRQLTAILPPENLCLLGVRSVDGVERELLRASGAVAHDMRAIDESGVRPLLLDFLDRVHAQNGLLHVSLDVDFIEPDLAPAVGTTVPGGASFREAHHVMELLHDSGLVTSLDLVELNPFLDERGRTARLMVELAASLFGRRVLDRQTPSY